MLARILRPSTSSDIDRDAENLHRRLTAFNHDRLTPTSLSNWRERVDEELALLRLEDDFVEGERRRIHQQAMLVPRDPDAFVAWFEGLEQRGPGQHDPLFPWLAREAPAAAMRWFLEQEVAGEAGFEDLVALTQVKLPRRAKLELARNYWDEMGQGRESGMHGPMLSRLSEALGLRPDPSRVVWESLALGNLMLAFGANRRYAFQSVGALGVIELTAPGRAAQVNRGLKRLGVAGEVRQYFALHATLDVKHSEAWNREVLRPLVAENAELAVPIAEGALLRLQAGARCFERYRQVLWSDCALVLSA
jgi:hypothetical protein